MLRPHKNSINPEEKHSTAPWLACITIEFVVLMFIIIQVILL